MNFIVVKYVKLACAFGVTEEIINCKLCLKCAYKSCRNAGRLIFNARFVKASRFFKVGSFFGNIEICHAEKFVYAAVNAGHFIFETSKMNDASIKEAIKKYKKIPEAKKIFDNLVGLCNLKLTENEIKKAEIINFMNLIKDLYLAKINESTQELKQIVTNLKNQKELIDNSINAIPNGFNNIVNSNDYVQGEIITEELKKFNKIDENIENKISEKVCSNIFINYYETDYIIINLPKNGNLVEGSTLLKKRLNAIPSFPSTLIIKYLQNQIYISYCININLALNDPSYPKFYSYITLKNKQYGLEYVNLSDQSFPQDYGLSGQNNNEIVNRQQVNSKQMDSKQFLSLANDKNEIHIKIFIIKTYYKN